MQNDIIHILSLIAGSYNMSFHQYVSGEVRAESFDGGIRRWENPGFQEKDMIEKLFLSLEKNTLTLYYDRFGCRYLILLLAQPLYEIDRLFLIGPYLPEASTHSQAETIREKAGWDQTMGDSLFEYRNTLPVLLDEDSFLLMVRRIAAPLIGQDILPLKEMREELPQILEKALPTRDQQYEQSMAASMIQKRYQKENEWLDALLTGNYEKVLAAQRELNRFQLPGRFSSLRGAQNIAIILNTLCRKNLERAAIHPAFIDQISRNFTQRITSCVTEQEVRALQREITRDYCEMVRRYSVGDTSPLLQNIMNEALLSLDGEVSLHTLSEKAGVGESYLSARFREETGMTFSSWLREKRMTRAKELLARKELSIAQVAEQVGILDVSYFIRVFKKEVGMTPGEWRKKITK